MESLTVNDKDFVKIAVKTFFLERKITSKDKLQKQSPVILKRKKYNSVDEYLKVYYQVGHKWGWSGRLLLSPLELKKELNKENIHTLEAYIEEKFIGYIEMNLEEKSSEIIYFGLLPQNTGRGLGSLLMGSCIDYLLESGIHRVWLHTCEYDHPSALDFYQKLGFEIYKENIEEAFYPEKFRRHRQPKHLHKACHKRVHSKSKLKA